MRHGAKPSDAKDSNDPNDPIDPKRTAAKARGNAPSEARETSPKASPKGAKRSREAEAVLPRPRFPQAALLWCAIRGPLPVTASLAHQKIAAVKRVVRGSLQEVPRCDARPRQNCLSEAAMRNPIVAI